MLRDSCQQIGSESQSRDQEELPLQQEGSALYRKVARSWAARAWAQMEDSGLELQFKLVTPSLISDQDLWLRLVTQTGI